MSITTKHGDAGETDLLFGGRVPKTHARMVALGATDELNAALGLVRVHSLNQETISLIDSIQRELISMMGILAVTAENFPRYITTGFSTLDESHVDRLTSISAALESALPPMKDWVLPGSRNNLVSAHLDVARTVCRRAERTVAELFELETMPSVPLLPYLNRLSDLLWLQARWEELASVPQ